MNSRNRRRGRSRSSADGDYSCDQGNNSAKSKHGADGSNEKTDTNCNNTDYAATDSVWITNSDSNRVLTSNDKWNRTPPVNSSRSSPPSKPACSKMSSTWLPLPLLNDVCYSCLATIVQTQLAMLGLAYFFQLGPLYFGLGFLDLLLFLLPGPSGILRTMTFPPPLATACPQAVNSRYLQRMSSLSSQVANSGG